MVVMKVALGQFAVTREWQQNVATCRRLMREASSGGADLLVLPEGILARDIADPDIVLRTAQPLDGPFVTELRDASRGSVLIVLRDGRILAQYKKLHLYDAFSAMESATVTPGAEIPPLVEIGGFNIGLMTCYDVRFPELARRLALDGADVLVLPSAWVKGPLKEAHWEVLVTARALENTCYVVAVSECGERNIGNSVVVDPLGVAVARAAEAPVLVFAELDAARIAHARKVLPVLKNRRFARPEL